VAVCSVLGALWASATKKPGWVAGAFLGFAFLARQSTIFALPVMLYLLARGTETRGRRLLAWMGCLTGVGLFGAFYLWFNFVRFGNPLETGYGFIPLTDTLALRAHSFGISSLAYLPYNFFYLFLQGFHLTFQSATHLNDISLDYAGTSLLMASPFVILAARASWQQSITKVLWMSIVPMVIIHLLYYNNGWVELNTQRFSLDYLPLLIALIGIGHQTADRPDGIPVLYLLICYAIGLNIFTMMLPSINHALSLWLTLFQASPAAAAFSLAQASGLLRV
jgi:hypothetical protein